jgi:riboflavin kinase/FMN adenylyltransferase
MTFSAETRRVLALGFFDGVHLGHAALLKKTCERAKEIHAEPAVMTFDRHPDTLLHGKPEIGRASCRERVYVLV